MNFHVQGEYTRKLEVLASSYHSIYNTEHSKIYDINRYMSLKFNH